MSIKKNKKAVVTILILLSFIFSFNFGYAHSSSSLSTNKTSNINDQFDMQFSNAKILNAVGVNKKTTTIEVSKDYNNLNFNAGDMQFPGAKVEYSVDVINKGTVPARLESVNCVGLENAKAIKVIGLDNIEKSCPVLQPNEKYNIRFSVIWDEQCVQSINEKISFSFSLNYIQDI